MYWVTALDLDALAAEILAVRECYTPDEWVWIVGLADVFVEEARRLGVDPRERAAERMRALEWSTRADETDGDGDVARADLAMAAAIVYMGRIG